MSSRGGRKRPLALPKTPGRIVISPEEQQKQDEEFKKAGEKKKKWWKNKRSLMRLIEHKRKHQEENWKKIADDPMADRHMMEWTPSGEFLHKAEKWMLARYASFVIQNCLLILRNWSPQVAFVANKFGEGVHSTARYACLLLQSEALPSHVMARMTCLRRHLYGRAIQEHESHAAIEKTIGEEWEKDRELCVTCAIDAFLDIKAKQQIVEGRFPKSNLKYDLSQQWDEDWKEPKCVYAQSILLLQLSVPAVVAYANACIYSVIHQCAPCLGHQTELSFGQTTNLVTR